MVAHPPAETWRKIGLREQDRVALLHAPPAWSTGAAHHVGTVVRRRTVTPADVVVTFYASRAALERDVATLGDAFTADGIAWVAWPRRAAGHVSDLSDQVVRAAVLPTGLVDVKVALLDEDWSGLKFVRRADRRAPRR